jgi:dTDP-4-dehydrorhamnose reductase
MKNFGKITVIGGRGMLGLDLCRILTEAGFEVQALDLPEFDISDKTALARVVADSGAVINCAAYTNVDGAEKEQELAWRVNAEAPGHLGELVAAAGKYMIHLSTDFVFDGKLDRPYREDDPARPLSVYGSSKLAGEQALLASGAAACIVRLQWTYGGGGRHFISKLLEQARGGKPLRVVADQVGSPTWTLDVSRAIMELLNLQATGLYHYAAAGTASRFAVAEFVLRELDLRVPLSPCVSSDFPCPAARPLNSCFNCSKIDGLLKLPRPPWQDSMRRFLTPVKDGTTFEK